MSQEREEIRGGVLPLYSSQEEHYARAGRPIVAEVAARVARELGGNVPESDLESIGNEALVRLIRRYDPAGAPLPAYLRRYLRWAMLDKVRGSRAGERGRAGELGSRRARGLAGVVALGEAADEPALLDEDAARAELQRALSLRATALALPIIARDEDPPIDPSCDSSRAPDRAAQRAAARRSLRAAISAISDEIARDVVVRHYFGDEPFDHIAAELGLTVHQICRMHKRALGELHDKLGPGWSGGW